MAWKYSNSTSRSPLPSKRNTQILATLKLIGVLTDSPGLGVDVMRRCAPIYRKFFTKEAVNRGLPIVYVPSSSRMTRNSISVLAIDDSCARVKREKYAHKASLKSIARKRPECERTYVLQFLEKYINNLTGTDGIRTIGRTWYASRLKNSS